MKHLLNLRIPTRITEDHVVIGFYLWCAFWFIVFILSLYFMIGSYLAHRPLTYNDVVVYHGAVYSAYKLRRRFKK